MEWDGARSISAARLTTSWRDANCIASEYPTFDTTPRETVPYSIKDSEFQRDLAHARRRLIVELARRRIFSAVLLEYADPAGAGVWST
jgi:hypothetical protein